MEIGLKDSFFAVIYIVTIASIWNGFHNDIKNNIKNISTNKDDIKDLTDMFRRVMFSESGELLTVTRRDCDTIKTEHAKANNTTSCQIKKLNENVIRIMCHLKIDETLVLYHSKEDKK